MARTRTLPFFQNFVSNFNRNLNTNGIRSDIWDRCNTCPILTTFTSLPRMSRMISVQQVELTTINARGMWAIVPQKVDCLTSRLSAAWFAWYDTDYCGSQSIVIMKALFTLHRRALNVLREVFATISQSVPLRRM